MLARALPLFAILALGAGAGALGLFARPREAIAALNRFALYFAFPALVVGSLASASFTLPARPGFYLVHALAAAAQIAGVFALASHRRLRPSRAGIALAASFGNIAYLGIPYAASVLGDAVTGVASLSAAMHIAIGMTVGPALLVAHAGALDLPAVGRGVARQPLVWAPFVGLALRLAPDPAREHAVALASRLGAAAGPVALFMIGLYIHGERHRLRRPSLAVALVCGAKLAVFPALVAGAAWLLAAAGLSIAPIDLRVAILVAAMPTAVTAFSLAEDYATNREIVAESIVLSTVLSLVSLPVLAALLDG